MTARRKLRHRPGSPREDEQDEHGEGLERIYDPLLTPRAQRRDLPLPTAAETWRAMDEVRRQVGEVLSVKASAKPLNAGLLEGGFVVHMVAQHEAQHQETVLQAIALREDLPFVPTFVEEGVERPASADGGGSSRAECAGSGRVVLDGYRRPELGL